MRTKLREGEEMPWPLTWSYPNPVMTAPVVYQAKLHKAFIMPSREWQTFVGARIKEDLLLMREIGAAKTPEQMWSISARFWQKAAEDYAREYGVITKLAGDCVISGVPAAGEAVPAQPMQPLSKAA